MNDIVVNSRISLYNFKFNNSTQDFFFSLDLHFISLGKNDAKIWNCGVFLFYQLQTTIITTRSFLLRFFDTPVLSRARAFSAQVLTSQQKLWWTSWTTVSSSVSWHSCCRTRWCVPTMARYWNTHTHVCTQIITKNSGTQRYRMNSCLYEPQTKFPEQKAHVGFNLK